MVILTGVNTSLLMAIPGELRIFADIDLLRGDVPWTWFNTELTWGTCKVFSIDCLVGLGDDLKENARKSGDFLASH